MSQSAVVSVGAGLGDLLPLTLQHTVTTVSKLDDSIEENLGRVDEVSVLLDSLRVEVSNAVDSAYPELMKMSAELQSLYAVIDSAEVAVNHVASAAKTVADRMEVLQKGYESKHPEGFSKVASWFGALQRQPIDAPVNLPPWDPKVGMISAEAELANIRQHVGTVESTTEADAEHERVVAEVSNFVADAPAAAPAATLNESADRPAAGSDTTGRSPAPKRAAAIASGEEDEEEDDD